MMSLRKRVSLHRITTWAILVAFIFASLPGHPARAQEVCTPGALKDLGAAILGCAPQCGPGATSEGITQLRGADNREKIWNFFIDKGLAPHQAAGVMGNIQVESASTWSPVVFQTTADPWTAPLNNAMGIAQWDGGRRVNLLNAIKEAHPNLVQYLSPSYDPRRGSGPPDDVNDALLSFELEYLVKESMARYTGGSVRNLVAGTYKGNEWETLKTQPDILSATVYWHDNFEISAQSEEGVRQIRGGHAQAILEAFANTTTGANCTNIAGFASAVLAYAWPEYKDSRSVAPSGYGDGPWGIRKPEYIEAVTAADRNGIYRGGYHGVDCGGFVTLLMLNSGFEPGYNYQGKISQGASNVAGGQIPWLVDNWTSLGNAGNIDPATLRPGDVAVSPTHTFVWVGDIDNFSSKIASASFGDRAPMAGTENPKDSDFTWYRKAGT